MNIEEPAIKTEVVALDTYPFQGGSIRRDGISWAGQKYSAYRIESGRFKCSTCGKVFTRDDDVLAIYWESRVPTNFVCVHDRGLFIRVDNNDVPLKH